MIVVNKIRSWKQCFYPKYLTPFCHSVVMNIENTGTYHILNVVTCKSDILAVYRCGYTPSNNNKKDPVIEKECFAIIYCLTKLRQYLLGAKAEMKNTRVQRWAILLD